ncbi:MAG: WbqC family protein [Leptolyngbya sp. SIO1D8]|nr:WbqC family protein [Leptolyngbya sp. SIO1D8]
MTIAAIHQTQYFPYLGFFHKLAQADIFVVMDNVEFLRRGLQHRNKIKTAQGDQWLTVPVLHRQKQLINEVKINPDFPWARKHWGALCTNYSPAPYFDLYADDLQEILFQDWKSLHELNLTLLIWTMRALSIDIPIVQLSELPVTGQKSQRLIEACQAINADTYLSGIGGKNYMNLDEFEAANIKVIWQNFTPPIYPQLFSDVGFIPNLSILDVLFCCGPDSCQFLADPVPASLKPLTELALSHAG